MTAPRTTSRDIRRHRHRTTETGLVALVRASGPAYPQVLTGTLSYPVAEDQDGDVLKVFSGKT
jgi:hypothetical protein